MNQDVGVFLHGLAYPNVADFNSAISASAMHAIQKYDIFFQGVCWLLFKSFFQVMVLKEH